jgi:hypothetical protein
MAVVKTVDDERRRVAVDSPIGFDVVAWQVRRPRRFYRTVRMMLQFTVL